MMDPSSKEAEREKCNDPEHDEHGHPLNETDPPIERPLRILDLDLMPLRFRLPLHTAEERIPADGSISPLLGPVGDLELFPPGRSPETVARRSRLDYNLIIIGGAIYDEPLHIKGAALTHPPEAFHLERSREAQIKARERPKRRRIDERGITGDVYGRAACRDLDHYLARRSASAQVKKKRKDEEEEKTILIRQSLFSVCHDLTR